MFMDEYGDNQHSSTTKLSPKGKMKNNVYFSLPPGTYITENFRN